MYLIRIFILALPFSLLSFLPSSAQNRTDRSGKLSSAPHLSIRPQLSDVIASLPATALEKWRSFRGILIEVDTVRGNYPLLPTLFFDRGKNSLPSRYKVFAGRADREDFAEDRIPGGTIQKYWHILNIVGCRMKHYPKAAIRLAGGYSKEEGEMREVAEKRASYIRDYLITIWGIEPQRIGLLPVSPPYGKESDTALQEELRFVRIESDDAGIVAPIRIRALRLFASPHSLDVRIDPSVPPGRIVSCRVEAYRMGEIRQSIEFPWHPDSTTYSMSWNWFKGNEDLPVGEESISFRATLTLQSGEEIITNRETVPVMTVPAPTTYPCFGTKKIKRFSLFLFPRGRSSWCPALDSVLATDIAPEVPAESHITVTGYCNSGEEEGGSSIALAISAARAKTVTRHLLGIIDPGLVEEIRDEAVGSAQPLFSNELPEGRGYNRTVQIIIQYPQPRETKEWWEQ